jgi:integrase
MGSIYRRGKTLWIKYYRNGKAYRESTKTTKETDARRLLKKREGEISEGRLPGIYFDRVRFEELAEDYLLDYRVNGKDTIRAELSVKHLKGAFEGLKVAEITTPRIQAYIEERLEWTCLDCKERFSPQNTCPECGSEKVEAGAAPGTVNRELAALKRMLNLGAKQTPPKVDRVPHIPMLKENNVRKGFFEHGDFLTLRDNLPKHLRGLATFAYKTGWRIQEVCALTWAQVDLKGGIVRLEPGETKNEEGRTVYVDEEVIGVFQAHDEKRRKLGTALPWVFLNEEGTDRVKRFDKAWRTACKASGVGVRLFHDFRRTAVRNMVRAGVPERVAMMVSGHKTRSVFERYNIVSDADLRLAAEKQAAYLESQTGTKTGTIVPIDNHKPAARL